MRDPEDRDVPFDHGSGVAGAWPGARLSRLHGLGHRRLLRDPEVIAESVGFITRADA